MQLQKYGSEVALTQDERWQARYNEEKTFIEENHHNPTKNYEGAKLLVHFFKRGRKQLNAGELKETKLGMFMELLELSEEYKKKNQYA